MSLKENIILFYEWFTNPQKERIVSKKIYLNYIFLIGVITFFTLTIVNYFLGFIVLSLYSLVVFIIIISLWGINRHTKTTSIAYTGAFILMLVLLNLFYVKNNGFFGPTVYFLFPSTFILMYFGVRKIILPLFIIIFLNIGIFTYMEVQQLIITLPYQSRSLQFLDLYISLLITITAIIIFLSGIIRINIKEQRIAQESNKLKTAFLANTSHDIRTPVSSILGFCTLLRDDDIAEEELQSFVSIIHSNSQQLLSLINDIFDISIIESGNFVLHPVAFDLNKLIKEIQLNFSQSIKASGKDILLQAHYGLHHNQSIIYADSVRINQILNNLIQNAINHTKSGAIIYGYEKDLDTNTLLFYVKDTGAGIPRNMLEGIFERNITDVSKSNIKGTGLGLHISRSLVKLMKGKIWVYSKEGEGSHFFFRIPLFNKTDFPT